MTLGKSIFSEQILNRFAIKRRTVVNYSVRVNVLLHHIQTTPLTINAKMCA